MKLFPKLALTMTGVLLASTVGLSLTFYWMEERSLRQQADHERHAILDNLVHMAQESFLTNDDLLLIKYAGWLQKWNPSVVSASVVDASGGVIAHSEPSRIGQHDVLAPTSTGEVLVLTQAVNLGHQGIATASVGFSERVVEEALQSQLIILKKRVSWIAGMGIGAGLILAFLLSLSWTRPMRILAQAAGRVGQGKYHITLNSLPLRRDELGGFSRVFQSMVDQLKELDQMKEDFVSAVTHELRSPLGAIESYLNVIDEEMKEGIPASTWQTYVDRLRVNTQRLTRFVNDLLDVAALERGKVTLQRQPTNVGHILQDVLGLFAAKMGERQLVVRTAIEAEAPAAMADPDKVRQIFTNLISNAIKFTPVRGTIEAGLLVRSNGRAVEAYVKDSGVGISEQDRERIFNKFEQVVGARQNVKGPKGTGLGLSICRALVELHGGTIGVESTPGDGSRFYFTLPTAAGLSGAAVHERIRGELV